MDGRNVFKYDTEIPDFLTIALSFLVSREPRRPPCNFCPAVGEIICGNWNKNNIDYLYGEHILSRAVDNCEKDRG